MLYSELRISKYFQTPGTDLANRWKQYFESSSLHYSAKLPSISMSETTHLSTAIYGSKNWFIILLTNNCSSVCSK